MKRRSDSRSESVETTQRRGCLRTKAHGQSSNVGNENSCKWDRNAAECTSSALLKLRKL